MPVYFLSVTLLKRILYLEQPTVLNTMLLTDQILICIYFRTTNRHLRDQNISQPTSKLLKMWFGPNIKYLSESFFADFCCQEGISFCVIKKAHDPCYINKINFLVLLTPCSINSTISLRPIYWNSLKISPPNLILSLAHLKRNWSFWQPLPNLFLFQLVFNLRPQTKLYFQ